MVAKLIVKFRFHNISYATLHIVVIDITIGHGHAIHRHQTCRRPVFITKRLRKT